jgi:hypothetical protein
MTVGEPERAQVTQAQLSQLSPVLQTALLTQHGANLEGTVNRLAWSKLTPNEREAIADKLAKNLQAIGVLSAQVSAYKDVVIRIELGVVTSVK